MRTDEATILGEGDAQQARPKDTAMTNPLGPRRRHSGGKRWATLAAGAVMAGTALMLAGSPGPGSGPIAAQAAVAPPDVGAMGLVTQSTGARAYWAAGYTGRGVDVAIIDSGIAPVNGLTAPGKVILGPDLSFESQDPSTRYLDTNGHGTHLAGIIAGRDDAATSNYANDTTNFLGMAPDARIVSIKVADFQGHTDVSQMIAAIDWVVQHKNDNGMNIRVLNIAFGTDSTSGWLHDPLVFAAEQAWKQGIFVVVSAGNDGPGARQTGALSNLASSHNVMSIGATDMQGTASLSDDLVAPFSSGGTSDRWIDIVAPGSHVVSLKSPGSWVATSFASTGTVGDRFFRGSGTSQAAAVVSGAAALIIQQRPSITPNELKNLIKTRAQLLVQESMWVQGAGALALSRVLNFRTPHENKGTSVKWSDGLGTLDSTRGSSRLVHDGVTLTGEIDIFGAPWNSAAMANLEAMAASWSGGAWNGNQWTESSWSPSSWSASSWSASSWAASSWSASSWSASSWSASSWSASSWSASSWSASSWSSSSWSSSSWSSAGWYR